MIVYKDMTFCSEAVCANKECRRHESHVPDDVAMPVSWLNFNTNGGCPDYVERDPGLPST